MANRRRSVTAKRSTRGSRSAGRSSMARLLAETKGEVDRRLAALLEASAILYAESDPALSAVHQAASDLCLRGGKRFRAALVRVGELASGGAHAQAALGAGVAVELLQSFFLIQDDWMDRDLLRRGGPTVHVTLSKRFGSTHRGAVGAVLAGDYTQALALKVLANLALPSSRLRAVLGCFAEMQADAIIGQQLDTLARSPDPSEVCRLKTASYSVRGPLLLGALLGGAKRPVLEALTAYAEPLGIAFQFRDDLLSAFGEPEIGKPRANDLVAGKPTLLSQLAFLGASPKQREALRRVYGKPKSRAPQIRRALDVMEVCGARGQVEAEIERHAQLALAAARSPVFSANVKRLLRESVELLVYRAT